MRAARRSIWRFSVLPLSLWRSRPPSALTRRKIRLVLDGHLGGRRRIAQPQSRVCGGRSAPARRKAGGAQGIMHHKFVLLRPKAVVTGSFNWTRSAEHINYENAHLDRRCSSTAAQYAPGVSKTMGPRAGHTGQPMAGRGSRNAKPPKRRTSISRKIKKALNVIMAQHAGHIQRENENILHIGFDDSFLGARHDERSDHR